MLLAGCATGGAAHRGRPQPPPLPHAVPTGIRWMIAGSALGKLADVAGFSFAARYFNGPQTTIITGARIASEFASWRVGAFALSTSSLGQLRGRLGALSPKISMVLYDPENWAFTPIAQQEAVGPSTATAAGLARAAGRKLIVAPATNLAQVVSPGSGPTLPAAFLRTGILGQAARSADWVEIQAQGLESQPARYLAFVGQAVAQIRRTNSRAVIYAGLSTNPSGQPVSAPELVSDVRRTSDLVSGYWLSIPSGGPACPRCGRPDVRVAVDLLTSLAH